ncbi:MAG: membrane integrity-associated transporter subunit PqiC [Gammaproteobacteria bacterium]|nr:membrane integrity-associated transporter subunit PqiC [Gammaproteobacteria bacterium]
MRTRSPKSRVPKASTVRAMLLGLVSAGMLAACGQGPVKPPDRYYRMSLEPAARSSSKPLHGNLLVQRFRGDGLVSQRPLVYADRAQPETLSQYNYHFWTDTPTIHLQELAIDYLRSAALAPLVVSPDVRVDSRYELDGQIRRLEHLRALDESGEPADQVALSVEFTLMDNEERRVLLLERYSRVRAITPAGDDASSIRLETTSTLNDAARALESAYAEILDALLADIDARDNAQIATAMGSAAASRP